MELKKEKTLLVAYDDHGNRRGAVDLYTGTMYGIKGQELIGVPACFKGDNLYSYSIQDHAIIKCYFENRTSLLSHNNTIRQRFESLISVGLIPRDMSDLLSNNWKPLKKDMIQYFKEQERGVYSEAGVSRAILYSHPFCQHPHDKWVIDAYMSLVLTYHLPEDIVAQLLTRCELEHVNSFYLSAFHSWSNNIVTDIRDFYNLSIKLYGTVTVERNFLTRLGFLRYTYALRKNELIGQGLMMHNNDPRLAYEDNNFIVTYLLTPEDFHKEGEAQNNCVERLYMEKVADGITKVVAIRNKNNPEKSLITCEVSNDGKIIQYLSTNNQFVDRNSREYDFQIAYQNHLDKVWNA